MGCLQICDVTLKLNQSQNESSLSFREKLEIAKLLDRLLLDTIELPAIRNPKVDALLAKSIAQAVENSNLAIPTGLSTESVDKAWEAISSAQKPRLQVEIPVSTVQMEYQCHKKPDKILVLAGELVRKACELCSSVEFVAQDASRAEKEFLYKIIETAIENGAGMVTLCDSTGEMFAEESAAFISETREAVPALKGVELGYLCSDALHLSSACTMSAISSSVTCVKTSIDDNAALNLENLAALVRARGAEKQFSSRLMMGELQRVAAQIKLILHTRRKSTSPYDNSVIRKMDSDIVLDKDSTITEVAASCRNLGYELSEEDKAKVYEAFKNIARQKDVGEKELDAIVASASLQVPPAYHLESYVINSGNIITATAHIRLKKDEQILSGLGLGDGPIDAAFLAIEQILGHHYELDDFQIQAVTEGHEAMGQAMVRLRASGKLYSGMGISLDIIGASIRAYLSALNKIVYEKGLR